jgi:pSer/pThr/pTyr-binding forkhead associated (FHA) protein
MPKIVCLSGANADYEYELPEEGDFEVSLGRSDENDICVMDRKSSRFHCKIIFENGSIHLEDLGSTNGVYLNNEPVNGIVPMDYGDLIGIGETVFALLHDDNDAYPGAYESNSSMILSKKEKGRTQRFEVTKTTTFRKVKTEQAGNQIGFLSFFEKKEQDK